MKKVLLMATAGLVCLFAGSSLVYADDAKVSDFIGEYIGDMPEVDKYANPDVMKLYFNDDGNLERYPCLPIFLHTYPTNFAAQTAIITLIFIVYYISFYDMIIAIIIL